uniref:DNA/RNA non-specific nuclease 4 n=1 Tax=Cylas puncticollis TaxID=1550038 RepID=A0A4D6Q963_9CUCU|nr:DNA/RNA non-specific nuclease 4 [Cylas puncticollis]
MVTISCPGNRVIINGTSDVTTIEAKCISDQVFQTNQQQIHFNLLNCQDNPREAVRYTRNKCNEGGHEVQIGYDLDRGRSISQIRICFDDVKLTPIYSQYILKGSIAYRRNGVPNPYFRDTGFYTTSRDISELYRRNNERRVINTLVGLHPGSEKYIRSNGELFINRGHLAAKGDFVYVFEQLATFNYVNTAPQWASFNGGNWNEVEISVRSYASRINQDLEIYTGVYGVTSLPHEVHGRYVELYLDLNNVVPVPLIFWKIVHNPSTGQGIVIVGINNPYVPDLSGSIICPDVSAKVTWFNAKLKKDQRNIELGYIYACDVHDFKRTVYNSPYLNTHSLLL